MVSEQDFPVKATDYKSGDAIYDVENTCIPGAQPLINRKHELISRHLAAEMDRTEISKRLKMSAIDHIARRQEVVDRVKWLKKEMLDKLGVNPIQILEEIMEIARNKEERTDARLKAYDMVLRIAHGAYNDKAQTPLASAKGITINQLIAPNSVKDAERAVVKVLTDADKPTNIQQAITTTSTS